MLMRYSYYLWINQIINIIAVAILKWSICAYLLVLDFSRLYRAIVWVSILVITAINFLAPVFTLFGCAPLEANWNRAIKDKKCWAVGNLPLSYAQGIVNVFTDLVYVIVSLKVVLFIRVLPGQVLQLSPKEIACAEVIIHVLQVD